MSHVPLVRPSFPDPERVVERWRDSTSASGQFSNFGPLWHETKAELERLTGRPAYPVSNGTEAVALAIHAAGANAGVYYEAFTFEATRIVAKRLDEHAVALRTNQEPPESEVVVVRTIPFGSKRTIRTVENLVVDAAGAFGAAPFAGVDDDAFVAVSFHATKNFPIGEGGAVFAPAGSGDWASAAIMSAMNFGYDHNRSVLSGYQTNAKLDELRCALLLEQLARHEFFANRSARIGRHSRAIAEAGVGAFLPYEVGEAQSLVVVGHKEPDRLVTLLDSAGFTARRVYHPYVRPHLLTYDEQHLVALPSDMLPAELDRLIETMKGIA